MSITLPDVEASIDKLGLSALRIKAERDLMAKVLQRYLNATAGPLSVKAASRVIGQFRCECIDALNRIAGGTS